ncbi:alpha-ketoglutarate-dependent dioxygenase AlkB [Streptomyces sp. AK02-01A]|uniref:alpha-ketoglutarate-dependent dioxygenase AlkB n=1 Tax=Streptomyces sp. AK02-01A TaxID=3028648 RepID=UPI0029AEB9DD|nr:alpha-ketoglutarate-dependent dioxygenase AlkB [Streptomyces sp. AK02-01A]MDX3854898.1 alpha-ketoglutarate-dependent dioxygenase AlkB [Streptomyces sp. AK02-01A]
MSLADLAAPAADQPLEFDNDFTEIERHDLDDNSWIEVIPRLIRSPQTLFGQLRHDLDWSQRQRWIYNQKIDEPRLTADYPQIDDAPVTALRTLAGRLSEIYDIPYDGVWVNLYRDQRDSTGWHGDYISCKREICTVPVLTLGHPRRFLIKPRSGGKSTRFVPDNGDLIVMRGRCQTDWLHAVPKQTTPASARISVNFQSTAQMTP